MNNSLSPFLLLFDYFPHDEMAKKEKYSRFYQPDTFLEKKLSSKSSILTHERNLFIYHEDPYNKRAKQEKHTLHPGYKIKKSK